MYDDDDVIPNLQKLNEVCHQNMSMERYFDVLKILVVDAVICKVIWELLEKKGTGEICRETDLETISNKK